MISFFFSFLFYSLYTFPFVFFFLISSPFLLYLIHSLPLIICPLPNTAQTHGIGALVKPSAESFVNPPVPSTYKGRHLGGISHFICDLLLFYVLLETLILNSILFKLSALTNSPESPPC